MPNCKRRYARPSAARWVRCSTLTAGWCESMVWTIPCCLAGGVTYQGNRRARNSGAMAARIPQGTELDVRESLATALTTLEEEAPIVLRTGASPAGPVALTLSLQSLLHRYLNAVTCEGRQEEHPCPPSTLAILSSPSTRRQSVRQFSDPSLGAAR